MDDKNNSTTFQDSIEWATIETERLSNRSKGIPVFYLVLGAIIVLILVILIIYLIARDPDEDISALDMMKNDDVYDSDNDNDDNEDNEEVSYVDEEYIDPNDIGQIPDGNFIDPLNNN